MEKEKKTEEKKKKEILYCPLNKDLACVDCRLFKHFSGNEKVCVFVKIALKMPL